MYNTRRHTILTPILLISCLSTQVIAQTPSDESSVSQEQEIEVIEVTAEKRIRKLQDVPVSISVVDQRDLELINSRSLVDATTLVPNVIVQNQGGRTSTYFYTRGVGRSELNFPIVAVNVNGVALPDPAMFGLDLDAAQSIEFLRGPQGTLYGQNTLGGVININLQKPADVFSGSIDMLAGQRDYRESALRLEGPIGSDELRAAASLLWNDVDGYIFNPTLDKPQNSERTLGGSLYVIYDPSEDVSIALNYFGQRRRDGLPQYAVGDDLFVISNDAPTAEDVDADVVGLSVDYRFDDYLLTSQTGYVSSNRFTQNDVDFSPAPLISSSADNPIKQWSQELRLLSNFNQDYNFVVGVYGARLDNDFDVFINDFVDFSKLGQPTQINDFIQFNSNTLAAFGQLNWLLNEWELTFGLRYQYQRIETDNTNTLRALPLTNNRSPLVPPTVVDSKRSYRNWLPRLAVNYALSHQTKLYASLAKGFRAGGFNHTALTAERLGIKLPTSYDPEFTWNYELGAKWRVGNLRLDAALFYIDWQDLQAEQIAPGSLIDFRTNAASATSKGAEIEARIQLNRRWEGGVTMGYADASYDEFIELLTGADLSGKQIAGGAEFTWSAFARYEQEHVFKQLGMTATLSANGVAGRYFDTKNTQQGDDYSIVNAHLGMTGQNWQGFVFVRNLLDEQYIEFAFPGVGKAVNAPRLFGVGVEFSW